jgi:hypothetical protein
MPIIRIASFEDLLTFLNENKVPYKIDQAQKMVEVPTKSPPLVGSAFIRFEEKLPYVQMICPMVRDVPAERRAELERAICLANYTIALPGFGYHPQAHFVYFRLCVPMYDEGMLAASFQKQIMGVINNARDFLIPFRQVVDGKPGDEILQLAVEAAKAAATPAP